MSEKSHGPNWNLDADLKTVTVTFPSTPPVVFVMDTSMVDDMLKNLGEFRASMKPERSYEDPRGKKVEAMPNPRWATEHDRMLSDVLLHIRDARYGTLTFLLPRDQAAKLGQSLIELANSPKADAGKAN